MPPYRQLRDSEISIYTKHFQALEDFSRSRNHYALILEDDIKVDLDDINTLRQILMAHEFDFCDICESPGLSVESGSLVKIGNYECRLEKLKPPRTRNACSYIVNKKTAMQFLGEDYHYILPFDWSFSYFLIKYKLKTIWVDGLLWSWLANRAIQFHFKAMINVSFVDFKAHLMLSKIYSYILFEKYWEM